MKIMNKIGASVIITVLAVTTLCGCKDITIPGKTMSSFNSNQFHGGSYNYDELTNSVIGGGEVASSGIDTLNVDWVAGQIDLTYDDIDVIKIEETGKINNDDEKLRYAVNGNKLNIWYCKSGISTAITSLGGKALKVTVPNNIEFENITVDTVSAPLYFSDIEAGSFDFDGVSGGIEGNNLKAAKDIDIDTVSGEVKLSGKCDAENIFFDTTSGNFEVKNLAVNEKFNMDSVSGSIKANLMNSFDMELNSTSGSMNITIPKDGSFKVNLDSVSGDVELDMKAQIKGETYIIGDGEHMIEADTVSGGINISEAN